MNQKSMNAFLTIFIITGVFLVSNTSLGTVQADTNVGGTITSDTTWTAANSPYSLTSALIVNVGVTLTIQAGVTVNINNHYIQVNGTLTAIGTDTETIQLKDGRIIFTSTSSGWNDQTNTGCTIQYATITTDNFNPGGINHVLEVYSSAKIDRNSLYGNSNTDSLIAAQTGTITNNYIQADNCDGVEAGGNAVVSGNKITNGLRGIEAVSGSPVISRNLITGASRCGLSVTNTLAFLTAFTPPYTYIPTNPIIQDNTVVNNHNGLEIFQFYTGYAVNATIINNSFLNSQYNIYLASSLYEEPLPDNVEVTENWWGTTDSNAIAQKIYDHSEDSNMGTATFDPYLNQASSSAPPLDYNPIPDFASWLLLPFLMTATLLGFILRKHMLNGRSRN